MRDAISQSKELPTHEGLELDRLYFQFKFKTFWDIKTM